MIERCKNTVMPLLSRASVLGSGVIPEHWPSREEQPFDCFAGGQGVSKQVGQIECDSVIGRSMVASDPSGGSSHSPANTNTAAPRLRSRSGRSGVRMTDVPRLVRTDDAAVSDLPLPEVRSCSLPLAAFGSVAAGAHSGKPRRAGVACKEPLCRLLKSGPSATKRFSAR
jgi:hypothetical protein